MIEREEKKTTITTNPSSYEDCMMCGEEKAAKGCPCLLLLTYF